MSAERRPGGGANGVAEPKPVVYVVDDDVSLREALQAMVAESGFQPEVFASAAEFLRHSRQLVPGCLILDVSLPDLNGLEVQRLVGAGQTTLPIVFITGHGDIPMTVEAMKAGAAEFLTKPFSPEALLAAVVNAVERDVMALVTKGQLNKQVAAELGISEITVKAHRGKVMRKMKARTLADLLTMAARLREASGGAS